METRELLGAIVAGDCWFCGRVLRRGTLRVSDERGVDEVTHNEVCRVAIGQHRQRGKLIAARVNACRSCGARKGRRSLQEFRELVGGAEHLFVGERPGYVPRGPEYPPWAFTFASWLETIANARVRYAWPNCGALSSAAEEALVLRARGDDAELRGRLAREFLLVWHHEVVIPGEPKSEAEDAVRLLGKILRLVDVRASNYALRGLPCPHAPLPGPPDWRLRALTLVDVVEGAMGRKATPKAQERAKHLLWLLALVGAIEIDAWGASTFDVLCFPERRIEFPSGHYWNEFSSLARTPPAALRAV